MDPLAAATGTGRAANADQVEFWNSASGERWVTHQQALDQRFAPITERLIERAGVRPGECVIDVGCGTGTTTLQLAEAVGAHGSVLAIDIAAPLLAAARRRCLAGGLANVRLVQADAQTHRFERACHDLVVSRFGVMFFDDPVGAFANLKSALRPGGRLVFACWGPLEANPWFLLPLEVAVPRLGPPAPQPPRAPGPLAFSEPDYVDAILTGAGFTAVRIDRVDLHLPGACSTREEAELMSLFGPLSRLMRERGADETTRRALVAELADRLEAHQTTDGVRLPAAIHLVSASARQ
ncbi:MAG TPA: methyltransferase domain-containing protein [Geminicoccaceae bacterium]|nr:methyltransferase domain-containing protein [Geminicoccaceae bacterium]